MDRETLLGNLQKVFSDYNKEHKCLQEVWLSYIDEEWPPRALFNLNVKLDHDLNGWQKRREIWDLLQEKAKNEGEYIRRICIEPFNGRHHCGFHDFLLYIAK